jgi:RND superfamily putative drug exporter
MRPAMQHPGRTLTISVLGLALLALPTLSMKLQATSAASLPRSIPATQTLDRLSAAFPSQQSDALIVVHADAADAPEVKTRLTALAGQLDKDRLFAVDTANVKVRASADATVHVLKVQAPYDPESAAAKQGVKELRGGLVAQGLRGIDGAEWAVGGETAANLDTDQALTDAMPWVIGFVVALTMLMMGWVFRSVAIAVTTAAVNLLSAGAAFGVLVLTFQNAWAEKLLGFESTGTVVDWIPLFTFAVLFGLSMDYHVFVLSHIREAVSEGMSTRDAVQAGITRSAGTVTSAALVMVSVFAIFASLHMVEMKQMGVGLAVAVLVDALVVRVIVLPSLMTLLGRANWWPGRVPAKSAQAAAPAEATAPALVG